MAKGSFRFPLYGGGSAPDPSVYCPANGYIPDVPGAGGSWTLISRFKTEATTFTPVISAGSSPYNSFVWLVDSVPYEGLAPSIPTLSGSQVDVELYANSSALPISQINLDGDNVVGRVYIDHSLFDSCSHISMQNNTKLTGLVLPETYSGSLSQLYLNGCGLEGVLDLTMVKKFSTLAGATFWLYQNPLLEGINFASTITEGWLLNLYAYNCNLKGTLNLSMFTKLRSSSTGSIIRIENNSSLNFVTMPSSIVSGFMGNFQVNDCDLRLELDFSTLTSFTSASSYLRFYNNPNLLSVKMPASITAGTIRSLEGYNCNITGNLDLSTITALYSSGTNFVFYNNPNLSEVVFPSSYTGQVASLQFYGCNLSGTVDISFLNSLTTMCYLYFYSNPNLTGFTMPSSTTGNVMYFDFYQCNITGTLDLSMFTARSSSFYLRFYGNPNLTGVVLPTTVIGSYIVYLYGYDCSLGSINLSSWTIGFNANNARCYIQNNGMSTALVNELLWMIDSVTSSGYTGRRIDIHGSNAAPDSSSGGYDGLAAKASLQAKGFTVTTN